MAEEHTATILFFGFVISTFFRWLKDGGKLNFFFSNGILLRNSFVVS